MEASVSPIRKLLQRIRARDLHSDAIEVGGHQLLVDPGDILALKSGEVWEPLEVAVIESLVEAGDRVADLGAHIGYFTVIMARRVGERGHVWSFEPDGDNFRLLQRNIKWNGYRNVTAVSAAVGRESGTTTLYRSLSNSGDHRIYKAEDSRPTARVRSLNLDDFFAADHEIDLMKIDVQGAEPDVFAGAREFFSRRLPVVIAEFWPFGILRAGWEPGVFLKQLADLGFDLYEIDEELGLIRPADFDHVLSLGERRPHIERDYTTLLCVPSVFMTKVEDALRQRGVMRSS